MGYFFKMGLVLSMVLGSVSLYSQPVTYPTSFTVAQDGSGDYRTIQEAVNAVCDLSQQRVVIHIRKGVYHEKLVVDPNRLYFTAGPDKEADGLFGYLIKN